MLQDYSAKGIAREQEQVTPPDYSEEEVNYRKKLIDRMQRARDAREQEQVEFDGMTYSDYYESNCKAANSYIPPKKNRQDTRIVTGTTQEKSLTVLSTLLNYNFAPNVRSFDDEGKEIEELGENMEAMLKKSNELECPIYDQKRILIYKEALDQGDAFIEDIIEEGWEVQKDIGELNFAEGVKLNTKWKEKLIKAYRRISTNLICGLNFYAGDIRSFYMSKQPYIFTRKILTRSEAESIFNKWERWENVPNKLRSFNDQQTDFARPFRDWVLYQVEEDQVEVLTYQDKWSNELMIMCNGVLMLPIGFPLSTLNGRSEYTIVKLSIEPISEFFFYSKSIPAKTKVDQAVFDEMYRLALLKTRQSFMPAMANNSNRVLTSRIFYPGTITQDLNPKELQPIMEPTGVTTSEFAFIEWLKRSIDEKSVNPIFQGQSAKGQQTAREIIELQKQSMMKLGLTIFGVLNYEKERAFLRLYNILKYWTMAESDKLNAVKTGLQNVYKRIEIDDTFSDGTQGKRMIQFTAGEVPSREQLDAQSALMFKKTGKVTRPVYISTKALREIPLHWEIIIEPTEKKSDALDRAMFYEGVKNVFTLMGPQSMSPDYLKTQIAKHEKWDKDQAFVQEQPGGQEQALMQALQAQRGQQPQSRIAQGVRQAATPQTQRPSLNSAVQG